MLGIPIWTCPDCGQSIAVMYKVYHIERGCPAVRQDEEWKNSADNIDEEFAEFMETKDGKFMQYLLDTKQI